VDTVFKPILNASIDTETAKAQFAFQRRVNIPDFFTVETADRIHRCLMTATPWGFAYLDGEERRIMHRRELESITRSRSDRIAKTITAQAGAGNTSYGYFCYPIFDAVKSGWNMELALHAVYENLNQAPLQDLVKAISGKKNIALAECEATLFSHQHFATSRRETITPARTSNARRIAFALNFTRDWREDYGGYLQFYSKNGDICQAYKPSFNSLTLFETPQDHSISYVAPFASIGRLTISGVFDTN
jgi:SM-20-related protein